MAKHGGGVGHEVVAASAEMTVHEVVVESGLGGSNQAQCQGSGAAE